MRFCRAHTALPELKFGRAFALPVLYLVSECSASMERNSVIIPKLLPLVHAAHQTRWALLMLPVRQACSGECSTKGTEFIQGQRGSVPVLFPG